MNITIRGINPEYWKELKSESVRRGLTMGQAINIAINKMVNNLKEEKRRKEYSEFWDLPPSKFKGPDTKHLSRNVDEVLYGWKK